MRLMLIILLTAIIGAGARSDSYAVEGSTVIKHNLLLLPSSRAALERGEIPAIVACDQGSLRQTVKQLSLQFKFAFWIDRRVDSDALLTSRQPMGPLIDGIDRLAQMTNAEAGFVENILVIAPKGKLASIQATAIRLHDQLSAQSTSSKQAKLLPLEWPMLTTPSELATKITTAWSVPALPNTPHDLMNEGLLPPCTLATQLALLVGGFDRAVEQKEDGAWSIVPYSSTSAWSGVYPASSTSEESLAALRSKFPNVDAKIQSKTVTISGPTAAHVYWLTRSSSGRGQSGTNPRNSNSSAVRALEAQRLTFELQNQTVGAALDYLSQNLKFELKWGDEVTDADKQARVSFKVRQQSLDEVLEKLSEGSSLKIKRTGTVVEVTR